MVPFHGAHQAGIATPAQDRLAFGALTVTDGATRSDLKELLREWTRAAAKMTQGQLVGEVTEANAPRWTPARRPVPRRAGSPSPSATGRRCSTAASAWPRNGPRSLQPLPPLPNEVLVADQSGGDLCIQACSDNPLVAFHAVRNLARLGMGTVAHKWMELGFGRTSSTSTSEATPRNLLGFKDGTRNIKAEQATLMNRYVWAGPRPASRGCAAAVTWSRGRSACSSRTGTATTWPTRKM